MSLFAKSNLFPGDYHLVNLRTLNENRDDAKHSPSKNVALILRRFAYDCDETYDKSFHWEQVTLADAFCFSPADVPLCLAGR